jgi:deazaflavin-dependent oxidoreductase (nitroreductase family)
MGHSGPKPTGILRWFLRAPILLYRLRLGWLLTGHFLMLTTTGRKSGRPHYAVVEVVMYNNPTDTYYIVSGWGRGSDWYRNIRKYPQVRVDVGFRRFQSLAQLTSEEQTERVLYDYAQRFPAAFKQIAKTLTGEVLTGTQDECARIAKSAPMVSLRPMEIM